MRELHAWACPLLRRKLLMHGLLALYIIASVVYAAVNCRSSVADPVYARRDLPTFVHERPTMGKWGLRGSEVQEVHFSSEAPMITEYAHESGTDFTPPECATRFTTSHSADWCVRWRPPLGNKAAASPSSEWEGAVLGLWESSLHEARGPYQLRLLLLHGSVLTARTSELFFYGHPLSQMKAGSWVALGHSSRSIHNLREHISSTEPVIHRLIDQRAEGKLSRNATVELFARLYAGQHGSSTNRTEASLPERLRVWNPLLLSHSCFWLMEMKASVNEGWEGTLWSTCGDRVVFHTSPKPYAHLVIMVNSMAVVAIFVCGIPFIVGVVKQWYWVRHSRGRALRVNLVQLLVVVLFASFDQSLIAFAWTCVPLCLKALSILFSLVLMGQINLFSLTLSIHAEQMEGVGQGGSTYARHTLLIAANCAAVVIGGELRLLLPYLPGPWPALLAVLFFWAPHLYYCVTAGGQTGFVAFFLIGAASLVVAPMAFVLAGTSTVWKLPRVEVWGLGIGVTFLIVETAVLILLVYARVAHLPQWMRTWQHVYATLPEKHQKTLTEDPLCAICRNVLEEGWDEADELWITPCKHLFHKSCLERWMEERMMCPLCRAELPPP